MIKKIFKFIGVLLLLLIIGILIYMGKKQYDQNQKVDNFFSNVKKIEVISYLDRNEWDEKDNPDYDKATFVTDKVIIKQKYLKDKIILNQKQETELIDLFKSLSYGIQMQAACYEPRHLIVFYDKNDKVYGYLELCFECGNYDCSKNMEGVIDFSVERGEEFEKLFKGFGIKYFG